MPSTATRFDLVREKLSRLLVCHLIYSSTLPQAPWLSRGLNTRPSDQRGVVPSSGGLKPTTTGLKGQRSTEADYQRYQRDFLIMYRRIYKDTRTNSGVELRVKTHSGDQTRNLLGAKKSS